LLAIDDTNMIKGDPEQFGEFSQGADDATKG